MHELEQKVHVYTDGEPFTARWDGREYELSNEPITIERGVAEHWQTRHPEAELKIAELTADELDINVPINPLEANDRGEAFASLKRPRRKASGE